MHRFASRRIAARTKSRSFFCFRRSAWYDGEAITAKAFAENWILITNDKDFGELVFRERRKHHGIVFLRLEDERAANKIEVPRQLLKSYAEKLAEQFVTVTETKMRFAGT